MAGHTPGPWEWHVDPKYKMARLMSMTRMRPIVMSFERWGMNRAAPEFRDAEKDLLYRVEHWLPTERRGMYFDIDHPDARLMQAAPDIYEALAELLLLKDDLKQSDLEEYERRKPLAWEAGRSALAKARGDTP